MDELVAGGPAPAGAMRRCGGGVSPALAAAAAESSAMSPRLAPAPTSSPSLPAGSGGRPRQYSSSPWHDAGKSPQTLSARSPAPSLREGGPWACSETRTAEVRRGRATPSKDATSLRARRGRRCGAHRGRLLGAPPRPWRWRHLQVQIAALALKRQGTRPGTSFRALRTLNPLQPGEV